MVEKIQIADILVAHSEVLVSTICRLKMNAHLKSIAGLSDTTNLFQKHQEEKKTLDKSSNVHENLLEISLELKRASKQSKTNKCFFQVSVVS